MLNLARFVKWAILNGPFDGVDLDGASIQEKAVECGILIRTKYDPKIHGSSVNCEVAVGDDWFVFSDIFLRELTL